MLRGVIAHEIGHIVGNHIIRRQEIIDNYTLAALGSAAIGLATALGTGGGPGIAIIMASNHIADRSIRAYSRVFESSADQMALKLLEKSHHSNIGMIKFFEQTKIDAKSDLINPYEQTHPLSQDRLLVLKNYSKKSKYNKSQNTAELLYKFQRISIKLAAYTLALNKLPTYISKETGEEFTNYFKAIKFFRIGNFSEAINYINKLLATRPNDPYYHELKGQILFEAGDNMALNEYNAACNLKKNDILIILGRAIVGVNQYKNDLAELERFYKDLLFVAEKEPDNLLGLYYLSMIYEKKGMQAKNYLNSAIIADKLGNKKEAKALANAALTKLKEKSPEWYKANDIIAANK